MNKEKKAKDPTRNRIFAAAFDHLKRTKGIKTQQQLADLMGVTKDTVSRIIRARTDVSEDAITRLQTASGCIFNLQWLRGENPVMLASDLPAAVPAASPEEKSPVPAGSPAGSAPSGLPAGTPSNALSGSDVEKAAASVVSPTEEQNRHKSTQGLPGYSSIVNALIAANDTTIASLKRELSDKEESFRREIAAKDETIASMKRELTRNNEFIKSLQQQVSDLRAQITKQMMKESLGNYPFTIGAADDSNRPSLSAK